MTFFGIALQVLWFLGSTQFTMLDPFPPSNPSSKVRALQGRRVATWQTRLSVAQQGKR